MRRNDGETPAFDDAAVADKRVFMVQVWQRGAAFRASVRDVVQEDALWFTEAAPLAAFLSGGDTAQPGNADETPASDDGPVALDKGAAAS